MTKFCACWGSTQMFSVISDNVPGFKFLLVMQAALGHFLGCLRWQLEP